MKADYVFKPFHTLKGFYVYDRSEDTFFLVDEDEYHEFCLISENKMMPQNSDVFQFYQNTGYLHRNEVKRIEHPQTQFMRLASKSHLNYMTLQVTQNCNLRCGYCIYSGVYKNQRTHSNRKMSWVTAKRAIDYYLEHSTDTKIVVIGFYGGEPLLEYDLIQKCVEYIESSVEGKQIRFNITTNGTLLTLERFKYLYDHHFSVLISLDGNKEEHNRHRKFVNGEGSFDIIIDNVKKIKEVYPDESKKIMFNAVMTPESDITCMMDFFQVDEVMQDMNVMFNDVTEGYETDHEAYETFWSIRRYEYLKYFCSLAGKINKKAVSQLAQRSLTNLYMAYEQMRYKGQLGETAHHNGPCMPGVNRLFITVNGEFFPCQNVSETSDYFKIGSVETGLDGLKMDRLLNNGRITEDDCVNCWNLSLCNICSQGIKFYGNEITAEDKRKTCKKQLKNSEDYLITIAVLKEFGCNLERMSDWAI